MLLHCVALQKLHKHFVTAAWEILTFLSLSDCPQGSKGSDAMGSSGDLNTDDRKDTNDLGLEVVQQISTAAGRTK